MAHGDTLTSGHRGGGSVQPHPSTGLADHLFKTGCKAVGVGMRVGDAKKG